MKSLKLLGALLVAGTTYASTVVFSPVNKTADAKKIIFETNDIKEVSLVKNLLTKENIMKVNELSAFVRIRLTTKNKNEGGEIIIKGGGKL